MKRASDDTTGRRPRRRPADVRQLEQLAEVLGVDIDASEDTSILAEPVPVAGLVIPNSLGTHPMEGCDGDALGRPGELTLRRYERFAAGGAGLIWVEATAVAAEGRSNPRQLWLHNESKDAFAALVRHIRRAAAASMGAQHRPVVVLQLTHSGRYSRPKGTAQPLLCQRDPYRDALSPAATPEPTAQSKIPPEVPVLTDEYLENLAGAYVEAATLAFEVGFDAVDIKACHGYLVSELLACHTREGRYGGSFENRTRFLLEVVDGIRDRLGPDATVAVRLGLYDAVPYPYGWGVDKSDYTKPDLTEPKMLLGALLDRGVRLINVTAGDPHYNPHYTRPFNRAHNRLYRPPEHPLTGVHRLINLAGTIQKQFGELVVVGTGYSWLGAVMPNVAAAIKAKGLAKIVAAGRLALAYPDFARDIIRIGRLDGKRLCTTCSKCSRMMSAGGPVGCAVRDKEIYGPIYEKARRLARRQDDRTNDNDRPTLSDW